MLQEGSSLGARDSVHCLHKCFFYFAPRKNVDFQIFQFRQTTQLPDETIDQFVTRLRKLAATCKRSQGHYHSELCIQTP